MLILESDFGNILQMQSMNIAIKVQASHSFTDLCIQSRTVILQ